MADFQIKNSLDTAMSLAKKPIDHPFWHAKDGEEYFYHATNEWVVINQKIGPKRERIICMVIGSVIVEEESDEHTKND